MIKKYDLMIENLTENNPLAKICWIKIRQTLYTRRFRGISIRWKKNMKKRLSTMENVLLTVQKGQQDQANALRYLADMMRKNQEQNASHAQGIPTPTHEDRKDLESQPSSSETEEEPPRKRKKIMKKSHTHKRVRKLSSASEEGNLHTQ